MSEATMHEMARAAMAQLMAGEGHLSEAQRTAVQKPRYGMTEQDYAHEQNKYAAFVSHTYWLGRVREEADVIAEFARVRNVDL